MTTKFKRTTSILTALVTLFCTACQENPDTEIVVHKDMDKMISEAQATDESKVDIEEMKQFDSYVAEFSDESLGVSVKANAEVDIPQTDKLSVFRVKTKDFTQEDIDTVKKALFGDEQLYDGVKASIETKRDIEEEIANLRQSIKEIEKTEGADSVYFQEYTEHLSELEEDYENAPDEVNIEDYPSDGKLISVSEMYNENPDDEYWSWQHDLNPDGEVVLLKSADDRKLFYAQNNADYGCKITYDSCDVDYEKFGAAGGGVVVGLDSLVPEEIPGAPENYISHGLDYSGAGGQEPVPDNDVTITQEEAEAKAEEFLSQIGVEGFSVYEGGLFNESLEMNLNYYRTCYILRYCRDIEGCLLMQESGVKHQEGWESEDNYNKQFWPAETIEFHITDAGIVTFTWNAPLEIIETVVDNSSLKTFDEVKSTFEKMITVTKATEDEGVETKINIDKVTLSYSRISEKDSFDTGLIVPVWAFRGNDTMYYDGYPTETYYEAQMCINAIDGSVIDAALGY